MTKQTTIVVTDALRVKWLLFQILTVSDSIAPGMMGIQGPVLQNLTKLLANMTLKFLTLNVANTFIFFCSNNINVFENTLPTTVN